MDCGLTFWKKVSKALIACALALLVATPAIDAVVCGTDLTSTAVLSHDETKASKAVNADNDHHKGGSLFDDDGVCTHGHCHHVAPYLSTAAAPVSEPSLDALRSQIAAVTPPADDHRFGLKRPPRA